MKDARDSAFLLSYRHDRATYQSVAAFSAQRVVDAIEACELRREQTARLHWAQSELVARMASARRRRGGEQSGGRCEPVS